MSDSQGKKQIYSLKDTCRCCLAQLDLNGISIEGEYVQEASQEKIIQQFQYLQLKIGLDDGKPQRICGGCFSNVKTVSSFRTLCQRSQEVLEKHFLNATESICEEISDEIAEEIEHEEEVLITKLKEEPALTVIEERVEEIKDCDDRTDCAEGESKEKAGAGWQWLTDEIPELQDDNAVGQSAADEKTEFTCNICSKSFSEELLLLEHVMDHPTKIDHLITRYVVCHLCNAEFKGKGELKLHMRTQHPKDPKDKHHACPICQKTFQSISNRNTHIQSHNENNSFKCSICGQGFKSKVYMNKHKKSVHEVTEHECPHCLAKFTNKVKFEYHLKSHDPNKKHKCRYCEKSFIQHHHLVNHERTHTGDRPFLCNYCGKHFKQECNFKLHLRYHTGVRPYVCNICGKDFVQRGSFVMHMKQHSGVKEWQCEHCGKHFIQKSSLTVHLRTHTGERPFKCDSCDRSFIQAQQLKYHKYSAHGGPPIGKARDSSSGSQEPRPHPYICQLCNKGFKLPSSLSSHLKVHTEVRKHPCPQCGNSFKRAEHLRIHINGVHLKQRPYDCPLCSKTFAQSGDRNIHMRRHTGEKPHTCSVCNKSFRLLKAMRAHARIHTGEKPYTCETCKVDFMTYTALATHTIKHEDGTLPDPKGQIQSEQNQLT